MTNTPPTLPGPTWADGYDAATEKAKPQENRWLCHPRNWTFNELRAAFLGVSGLVILITAMLT